MSRELAFDTPPAQALPEDRRRASFGMGCFIVTEAMLFVSLLFSYFLLARYATAAWPPVQEAPHIKLALLMLVVLALSSATQEWARRRDRRGLTSQARAGTLLTIALGVSFLVLQSFEYRERLKHLLPTSDAYGAIFYATTGLHGLHVALGLLMLVYALVVQGRRGGQARASQQSLVAATLYWHFVDCAWVAIVFSLYLLPAWRGG